MEIWLVALPMRFARRGHGRALGKGQPTSLCFDPKGKREAGCLRGSEEKAEAGKAGGIRHSSTPAELGAQEPGVWCPLENLGPDWEGEQGGQPSGGGLRWGRNTGGAAGGARQVASSPRQHHLAWAWPLSPHTQNPPEPLCHLVCDLEPVPGHLWALPRPTTPGREHSGPGSPP